MGNQINTSRPAFIDSSLLKRLLFLASPMALQSIISFSVNLADNLMVGSLGELALSGVFVANQIQNLVSMLVIGLSSAMMVLANQYWGQRDAVRVRSIVGMTLIFGLTVTGILFAVALTAPLSILGLFSNDRQVMPEALRYFSVIRFSYLFLCVTQVLMAAMRVVERVKIGMYLSMLTFFVNVFLNWVLIFGNLGASALGVQGAAIATLTARIMEFILMLCYVRFIDDRLHIRLKNLFLLKADLIKRYFRFGIPVIAGDIAWGVNLAVQGGIIGHLGATATASVSIATIIFQMTGVLIYANAGATAIIIGQAVGVGDIEQVKRISRQLQRIFVVLGLFSGAVLWLVREPVLSLYNLTPEAREMTMRMMAVLSVTIVGTAYQMSVLTGIVRAGGATHFVLVNDLIHIWGFVIPSSLLAAFVFRLDPVVVFAILKSDQILKCIVAVITVNRFKWIRNLTRASV